jgi:hypothetical protein
MRNLTKRSVNRPRPVLMLETLEDRRVMSVGGLLSALQPFATVEASHSQVSSVLTSLVAGPTAALSSVNTTTGEVPTQAAGRGVHLHLNVDVLFHHAENLRLDAGLSPVDSDQPLLTLAVGGKSGVGSTSNGLLNLAPDASLGLGGSNVVSADAGTQVGAPSGPVLDAHAGARAGTPGGLTASVNAGGAQGTLDIPPGGATIGFTGSSTGAGLGLITPAGNFGNTGNATTSNSPATLPAATLGAQSSAPLLTASNAIGVDGGGGSGGDVAFAVLPVTAVSVAGGAAAGAVAPPFDLGGGTDTETVLVNPDLEASGLTTRFQPYRLGGASQDVRSLLGPIGPQSGWLAAWWARLSHMAPWLAGLIVAGAAFEIRRRRRRAAKAIDRPLA